MKQVKLPYTIVNNQIIPQFYNELDFPWLKKLLNELDKFKNKSVLEWQDYSKRGFDFDKPYIIFMFALSEIEKKLIEENLESETGDKIDSFELRLNLFKSVQQVKINNFDDTKIGIKKFRQLSYSNIFINYKNESWVQSLTDNYKKIKSIKEYTETPLEDFIDLNLFNDTDELKLIKGTNKFQDINFLINFLNSNLIRKLMLNSVVVEIETTDHCKRIMRQAKLRGLICEIKTSDGLKYRIRISGPLSVLKETKIYGKRLHEFIPILFWSYKFKLKAKCKFLDSQYSDLFIDSSMQLKPANPPKNFDRLLEEKFYKEFSQLNPAYSIWREAEPFKLEDRLFFPDFTIEGGDLVSPIVIEIVGYWGDEYIQKKIEEIHTLKNRKCIFCINSKYKIEFDIPITQNHQYIFFKRKIGAKQVMEAINLINLSLK